ncbi:hypothetical protein SLA2020_267230 [Shorea laevis]
MREREGPGKGGRGRGRKGARGARGQVQGWSKGGVAQQGMSSQKKLAGSSGTGAKGEKAPVPGARGMGAKPKKKKATTEQMQETELTVEKRAGGRAGVRPDQTTHKSGAALLQGNHDQTT